MSALAGTQSPCAWPASRSSRSRIGSCHAPEAVPAWPPSPEQARAPRSAQALASRGWTTEHGPIFHGWRIVPAVRCPERARIVCQVGGRKPAVVGRRTASRCHPGLAGVPCTRWRQKESPACAGLSKPTWAASDPRGNQSTEKLCSSTGRMPVTVAVNGPQAAGSPPGSAVMMT